MLTKNLLQLQTEIQRHVAADQVKQGSYKTCFIGCLAHKSDSPQFIESEYGIPLAVSRIAESIFEGLPSDEAPAFFAAFPDAIESDGKDLTRVCWQFFAAELRSLPPVEPEIQAVINPVIDGLGLLAQGKEWSKEAARAASAAASAAARAARAASAADWAAAWAAAWAADRAADCAARAAARAADCAAWAADCAAWAAGRVAASAAGWAAGWAAAWAADWVADCAASAAGSAADCAARLAVRRRQRDLLLKLITEAPVTTTQENNFS